MDKRRVEYLDNEDWKTISSNDLKKDMTFMMFEPTGEVVFDIFGNCIFIATTDFYVDEDGLETIQYV